MSGQASQPGYLTPGMNVGPYLIDRQLGGGGFGFVYRVLRDGRPYALKIGHKRLSELPPEDRSATVERLEREVAALMSLHHRNIVRVHSFERWPDLEGGYPYLVMDLVEGTPLQEWRAGKVPSLGRIVVSFEKLADALQHMHELGIIHRDLKSQNILVNAEGEPFIVDFGIARPRLAYDVTRAAGVGTITHLTPEYVAFLDSAEAKRGSPFDWQPATDLYALGYVLYEALTGQPPVPRFASLTAKEEFELLAAIKGAVPTRPAEIDPRIPEALDELTMQLLEKEPLKRPKTAGEVVTRLREAREAGEAARESAWVQPLDLPGRAVGPGTRSPAPASEEEDAFRPMLAPEDAERAAGGAAPPAGSTGKGADAPVPTPQQAQAGAAVALPTVEEPATFDAGGEPDESEQESRIPEGWNHESQILKRVAAEFQAAAPTRRRWPVVWAAAAGGFTLLLLMLVVLREPNERPGPKTLLSAVEPGAVPGAPALGALPLVPKPASAEPVAQPSANGGQRQPSPPAAAPRAAMSEAPGAGEELERQFGRLTILPDGRVVSRPVVPTEEPSGIVRSKPVGAEPGVLLRSRRIASESQAPEPTKARGVAFGAHIQARLLTNLDTRTIANGPVEALLQTPYVVRGQVLLPTRTMVYGTASESAGRFVIRFNRLRLPDDTEVAFEGIALARDDGKAGLAASGRIGQEPKRGQGLGTTIAKGTGNILLDTITGGTGQSIVRNAGQAALTHEEEQVGNGQWALLLDAGAVFEIFVERAF